MPGSRDQREVSRTSETAEEVSRRGHITEPVTTATSWPPVLEQL